MSTDAEMRAALLAVLAKRVDAELTVAKALATSSMEEGTTRRVVSPLDGAPLASVLRTQPAPGWEIVDEAALREHLGQYDGCVSVTVEIDPARMPEALAVLDEHMPELLIERRTVTDEAIRAAVDQSKATGEAAAPGLRLVRRAGVPQVRAAKDAAVVVQRMVSAGLLDWSDVLALPSGKDDEVAS